jgi:UDP-3-O-[3-hydroxymyristoyl] glucosamine N-acyltransferase
MLLSELASRVGAALDGDGAVRIARVATLEAAGPETIAFLANPKYRAQLATTGAAAVIVAPAMAGDTPLPKLVTPNPYATYARVATLLHPLAPAEPGVHTTAVIGEGARVASSATIGPCTVIGPGATIGERVRIGAGCAVGGQASIGEDSLLYARVTIYDRCVVGPRAIIHSGAVIGADGFGMAEEEGSWVKIPQVGRVVIGADVEIGANTTIDRGAIDDTVIEDDVKLDNLVQIGHNCRIGAHTAIAGCSGISGSVRIGRNCKIGGAAMIAGHISIADGTVLYGGTGVASSIDTPGLYASWLPALPVREWRHVVLHLRRLRELVHRVRALEKGGKTNGKAPSGHRGEEER